MNRLLIATLFFSRTIYGQRSDISWVNPQNFKPLDFLYLVKGEIPNLNLITISNNFPDNWVRKNDIDSLMKLISSKQKCKCVVNPFSSYLPTNELSDLGGYAIFLIKSFKEQKKVNIGLHLCPKTSQTEVDILKKWWLNFNN